MYRHSLLIWLLSVIAVLLSIYVIYGLVVYNTKKTESVPTEPATVDNETEVVEETPVYVDEDTYTDDSFHANTNTSMSGIRDAYKEIIDEAYNTYGANGLTTYYIFDINSDNVDELIVAEGNSEGDRMYNFYTYDGTQAVPIGEYGGGHSELYGETSDEDGKLVIYYGHMDYEEFTYVNFEGHGNITTSPAGSSYEIDLAYKLPTYNCNDYTGLDKVRG